MKSLLTYIVAVFLLAALVSCKEDVRDSSFRNWNPNIALPLIDSEFDIDRVLSTSERPTTLVTGTDGVVAVVYSGELFRIRADEIFSITDFAFDLTTASGELIFQQSGMLLKHLDLSNGTLEIDVRGNIVEPTAVVLKIKNATKDGVSFVRAFVMNSNQYTNSYDLSGYKFDMTGNTGDQSNKMNIEFESHNSVGDTVELSQFRLHFKDLSFDFLDGYLGETNLGLHEDSLEIGIFNKFKSGHIILEDPKFDLSFENGFGLPMRISFSNFSGSGSGGSSTLDGDAVDKGITVGAPGDTTSGEQYTIEQINSGNSNIDNFLSISPSSINFEFQVDANVDNDTTTYNFVNNTSTLVGNLDLEIPLKGRLDSVIFEDEYDFVTKDLQNVDKAQFKLWIKNSFPVGVYFQLYFMDDNDVVLDSLIQDNSIIFKEAQTNSRGFSTVPSIEESFWDMGEGRFATVKTQAKKLKLRAMLLTDNAKIQSIKITNTDFFHLKLGVIARIHE